MPREETLLQVLSSESPTSRVSLWLCRCEFSGESRLRMRQESYSDNVGWFTQTHVDLTPDQWSQLKGGVAAPRGPSSHRSRTVDRVREAHPESAVTAGGDRGSSIARADVIPFPAVMAG